MTYALATARAPRLAGRPLALAAAALDHAPVRAALLPGLMRDAGVDAFRAFRLDDPPTVRPEVPRATTPTGGTADVAGAVARWQSAAPVVFAEGNFAVVQTRTLATAFTEGRADPVAVLDRVLAAVARLDQGDTPLRALVALDTARAREDAAASRDRHRAGHPLGPLDGVPVAVKDELDVTGMATTAGTAFLRGVASADAVSVARLRAAGAVILGKCAMHEIGIDTLGYNLHTGFTRNPYAPAHYPGGSSSGSAAAVAAGLCPLALGADGGGSIRVPAALCGVVGLKATFGRIPESGAFPLCWSVGHVGPIGATVDDVALAYAFLSGEDAGDPNSLGQPPVSLDGAFVADLRGLRVGLYRPWFEHADAAIVAACRAAVDALVARGAVVVDVDIPDLEPARVAHAVSILTEMALTLDGYGAREHATLAPAVRLALHLGRAMTARDYVHAQRLRTRLTRHFDAAFATCDVIATPATARTAPPICPDALRAGESDLEVTSELMRFVFPSNLTGHPALSVPVGHDAAGLPIGLQLIGPHWAESQLLGVGRVVEASVVRRAPVLHASLLG